ncbi:Iguana/Dzip1-like DAZ-interacting protein N-terminal-domain-containing protein, partial [Ochromonadaceae sp. CCMP2298]
MDILSEPVEEKPSLGGMYGSSGFFFQQRRGHLNLRSLAAINIDKLVREVDVDTLQVHIENITFCNLREEDLRYLTDPQIVKLFRVSQLTLEYLLYSQDKLVDNLNQLARKYTDKKRGLSKKRRELVQLEESTKLLHSQVRAKKQNIATLQDLLKEANRTREQELRLRLKGQKGQKGHEEEEEEKPSVKFFIQGPEGVCVEFAEKPERTVAHLLREARKAFVSRRDSEELPDLRLIHRGRMLLAEQTIGDCEIRSGDMLVAMLLEPKKPEPAPAPAPVQLPVAPVAPAPVDHEALTKHMLEIFSKQQSESMRELAADIK